MTQRMLVFQSLWAMERRHTDGFEPTLEANIERIADAGYDGVCGQCVDAAQVRKLIPLLRARNLAFTGQAFPQTVDDMKPVLELAVEAGVHHLDVQPDIRPRRVADCVPLLESWMRLAEQVDFPVLIETHRDRMTTDLHFTLDLMDAVPEMQMCADLSHILVGREFAWPVAEEHQVLVRKILDRAGSIHGRVASREQVQVEVSFEHHRPLFDLFLDWWEYGMASWRRRARPNDTFAFVCELGPKPYAITGADGNDLTDRWDDALLIRAAAEARWARTRQPAA